MVKMKLCFSKGSVLLIWLGCTLFFFSAQISIFHITFYIDIDDSGVTVLNNGANSTEKLLLERSSLTSNGTVLNNPSGKETKCYIPDDPLFPLCPIKIKEFNKTWDQKCHGEKYKVDPTSLCSVIQYLSEVQAWCPVLPWRQDKNPYNVETEWQKATVQTNLSALLEKFKGDRYYWMRKRIQGIWPQWLEAFEELGSRVNLHGRRRKKILVYMAGMGEHKFFLDGAFTGGPLGELAQWCDLISALYILGHELVISFMKEEVPRFLVVPTSDGCARQKMDDEVDLIFTDIMGVMIISVHSGQDYSRHKCKFRVLDSFGTDAEFNHKRYKGEIPGGRSPWGDLDLHLAQFMTMYPHSPDNSFLGFAVPRKSRGNVVHSNDRMAALVYGKDPEFWKGHADYIDTVKRYFNEVHATLGRASEKQREFGVPEYVINHGIINITSLVNLLQTSKVFVGLGQPFEGPAALEALANGCFFLNPKYIPPLDRTNAGFFAGKPLNRKITSQNPYAEVFVGEPFVQTVNIKNLTEVEEALREIISTKEGPHLPYEFTHVGMLERVNAYVENQDFCKPTNWPPLSELRTLVGGEGESCIATCLRKQLICEPKFFVSLNVEEAFKSSGFECKSTFFHESILAPSINTTDSICVLQTQPMLFSCRAALPGVVRICPCRSYRKEQAALCETC